MRIFVNNYHKYLFILFHLPSSDSRTEDGRSIALL